MLDPKQVCIAGDYISNRIAYTPATATAMVFYREMGRVHVIDFIILLGAFITAESSAKGNACNCQFNNVEALDGLIGAKIASRIGELAYVNNNIITIIVCSIPEQDPLE